MEFEDHYQGAVILRSVDGMQHVYSSQNYNTYYSIYIDFDCKNNPEENKIELTNIRFFIANYKGILNLGLVNIKFETITTDEAVFLTFKIKVRALERRREFNLRDSEGRPEVITIDTSNEKMKHKMLIHRELQRINNTDFFNPDLNPNHDANLIFDDEFYYRDGLEFNSDTYRREVRGGMAESKEYELRKKEAIEGKMSGKRCYTKILNLIY